MTNDKCPNAEEPVEQPQVRACKERREANTCMALGAGVGALGAGAAIAGGAVCPLCYFVAPGLIALGAYKRIKLARSAKQKR